MVRQVSCPSCGRVCGIPDDFKGSLARCPQCKAVMQVSPMAAAAPPSKRPAPAPARPAPATRRPPEPEADDEGHDTRKIALVIGGSVVAGVVLVVLIAAMSRSGGGKANPPEAKADLVATNPPAARPDAVRPAASIDETTPPPPTPVASPTLPSIAPGDSPAAMIQRIKAATVYIKMKVGTTSGTGTGFVIRAEGDRALIATNRHVAAPHLDGEIPGLRPTDVPNLTVVFRSGEGPGKEQALPGKILAVDTDPNPNRDLAIIEVRGVREMPRPIDPGRSIDPVEGMELRIYGFPFGAMMNMTNRGNPSITINKGGVAALRRDDNGRLSLIQIDGSINPGNSGGPIVDDSGRLIGVAVLKLKAADNIGLAIPAAEVNRLLAGRVGGVDVVLRANRTGSIELDLRARLADPLNRLRIVRARIAPAQPGVDSISVPQVAGGGFGPIPDGQEAALRIDPGTAAATGTVPFRAAGQAPKRVWVQLTYGNGSGAETNAPPLLFDLPARPGPLVAMGGRRAGQDERSRKSLEKLGKLTDPAGDCTMTREDRSVSIAVPGKLHILSPQIKDKTNKGVKNAPMVLAEVDGDFVAHVKVAGDMLPGTDPSLDTRGKKLPFSIQGAGLLLWQDRDNYLRLERSSGTTGPNSLTLSNRLIFEICKDGQDAGHAYIEIPEGPIHVLLVRKSGHLRCLFSPNGEKWTAFREIAVVFPSKIGIGLSAFNTSKLPFTARFEDFVLVDDRDKIDQELKP